MTCQTVQRLEWALQSMTYQQEVNKREKPFFYEKFLKIILPITILGNIADTVKLSSKDNFNFY